MGAFGAIQGCSEAYFAAFWPIHGAQRPILETYFEGSEAYFGAFVAHPRGSEPYFEGFWAHPGGLEGYNARFEV